MTRRFPDSRVFYRRLDRDFRLVTQATGARLVDESGKEYLDASGGAAVANIGHGVREVAGALSEAALLGYVNGTQFTHKYVESLALELAEVLPEGLQHGYFLASGSEVALALEAHRRLLAGGVPTRVVSMPCWSRFDAQDADYRESVLPAAVTRRLAIEAGVSIGWHKYVGVGGDVLSQEGFGASAPLKDLQQAFGFTPEEVVRRVQAMF